MLFGTMEEEDKVCVWYYWKNLLKDLLKDNEIVKIKING